MLFKPGDIVTDIDTGSMVKGIQGEVVSYQFCLWGPPEVLVRFDREVWPMHLGTDECPKGVYVVYPPKDLRLDSDWEPKVYARRIFGTRWHSIYAQKKPLNSTEPCLVQDCSGFQEKTIWFNVWGSVCNAHVCKVHAKKNHGYCMDSFPWRKAE